MSLIYLIRHGQASFGRENYDRLSELGVRQSKLLGAYFRRTGVRFDRVYSGSLERQTGTALAVLSELAGGATPADLDVRPEFNEFDAYSDCMDRLAEMAAADPALAEKVGELLAGRGNFGEVSDKLLRQWAGSEAMSPAGNPWKAFGERAVAALEQVRAENGAAERAAIFTSGGTIAALMQRVLGLSDGNTIRLARHTRNSSFSMLACDNGRFGLAGYNAVPHLELENDPALLTVI